MKLFDRFLCVLIAFLPAFYLTLYLTVYLSTGSDNIISTTLVYSADSGEIEALSQVSKARPRKNDKLVATKARLHLRQYAKPSSTVDLESTLFKHITLNTTTTTTTITTTQAYTSKATTAKSKKKKLNKSSSIQMRLPTIPDILTHLNLAESSDDPVQATQSSRDMIQPRIQLTRGRDDVFLVIGVPTTRRENVTYILPMMSSLFDAMTNAEKSETLVVIMIAEMYDMAFINGTIHRISGAYKWELESGLLEIIVPPVEYYPDLNNLGVDLIFNDTAERMKWRTRQNYDYSYLMTYAQHRGAYYLQLEDDVETKGNFIGKMREFMETRAPSTWLIIEFAQLGFIGKLIRTHHLAAIVSFLLMFASDKPCDLLFYDFLTIKACNPEFNTLACQKDVEKFRPRYKPSLFQHIGYHSSLRGKTQQLQDASFLQSHDNPPAALATSLPTFEDFQLSKVYVGLKIFWANKCPQANDFIIIEFLTPVILYKYFIKSGGPKQLKDRLYNASLQIKTLRPIDERVRPTAFALDAKTGYYTIDWFTSKRTAIGGCIQPNVTGEISNVRIVIQAPHANWLAISEIELSNEFVDHTVCLQRIKYREQLANIN